MTATAATAPQAITGSNEPGRWLFSARVDLGVFLGSALLSLAALWVGKAIGVLDSDTPDWAWVPAVLLIDVAHVYATAFRVYFDREELRRRPLLYSLAPVLAFVVGVALYSEGELVFWRAVAYLAVFHFVRQQYGWVALYRARVGEHDRLGRWIDGLAIYAATVYPLIYWHAHLPRNFSWFIPRDFAGLPSTVASIAEPVYWTIMGIYLIRSLYRMLVTRRPTVGKDIVVATTAVCWYTGIVYFNSDYAFTVTNVVIHGVPYLALIYWYGRGRLAQTGAPGLLRLFAAGPVPFLLMLWLFAYVEELFWDRGVWQDRSWLFGTSWDLGSARLVVVPLLALPQITHYVLDGFIWRRKSNPGLGLIQDKEPVESPAATPATCAR